MSCMRFPSIRCWSTLVLLALVQCGLPPGSVVGQDKPPDPQPDKAKKTTQAPAAPEEFTTSYGLKYANASTIARLLGKQFAELHVAADERTNSLVISGPMARVKSISDLIRYVDFDQDRKISVFTLRAIEPDEAFEAGLKLLFKGTTGNFAVDRARKTVIVSANQATLETVEAVIAKLELMQKARPVGDVQVRVVWLVNPTQKADDPDAKPLALPAPSDDLKEVLPALAKLGFTEPRVAAQFVINGKPNTAFQASGTGFLPYTEVTVTLSGQFGESGERIDMRMAIEVSGLAPNRERLARPGFGKNKADVAATPLMKEVLDHLETNITAPPGHFVVLGVTPMYRLTSAFVVQVLGEKDRKGASGN